MHPKIIKYSILILFSGFYLQNSMASGQPEFEKKIIRDSLDNLIINAETPVFIHISDNPDGKNSIKLNPETPEDVPLKFKNSGQHKITHFNKQINKTIPFYFTVDGIAPNTKWQSGENYFLRNDTIFGGKNFNVAFSSHDEFSGVSKIYYAVNSREYKVFKDSIQLHEEKPYEVKYFAVDNVGNTEKPNKIIIIANHTSPVTQLEIVGDKHENILSPRSEIKLTASDKVGIKDIYYSINEDPVERYSKKISVDHLHEGYHTIVFHATDKVGNKEHTQSFEFFVDKTPPIIIEEITGNRFVAGGKEYSSGRSQLRITAVDNKAGVKEIYYSINDEEYELYERPVFLSGHSGEINIKTYAVDKVNNKSEGRAYHQDETHIPYVDLNAPEIDFEIIGPQIYLRNTLFISNKSKVKLKGIDRESGLNRIVYRINQGEEKIFEEPFSIKKPGSHNINYTAFDNVENANNDNFSLYVDLQGPEVTYNFSIKSYDVYEKSDKSYEIYPQHVKLFLSATDEKTGADQIFYSINEQPEQLYNEPVTGFEARHVNNISIRATDMLGNETVREISFYITD